jgi:DNA-binding transcriptional ArsR family regulator
MVRVLQPTAWRTCRVLANSNRLKMFALLVREPGLTVSAAATRVRVSLPLASLYLRALEARGLLASKRTGRWVTYQVSGGNSAVGPLVSAMRSSTKRNGKFVQSTFKLATAFTHPRRIDVFRALMNRPQTMKELKVATRIPGRALLRHLQKLATRGFVLYHRGRPGTYVVRRQGTAIGRALAELASLGK